MWIHTTHGFFSAVEDPKDKRVIIVRVRALGDATYLAQWLIDNQGYGRPDASGKSATAKDLVITDIGRASDYPARVFVWRWDWAEFVMSQAESINYGNFKSAVGKINPKRTGVLHRVWAALQDVEYENPAGTKLGAYTPRRREITRGGTYGMGAGLFSTSLDRLADLDHPLDRDDAAEGASALWDDLHPDEVEARESGTCRKCERPNSECGGSCDAIFEQAARDGDWSKIADLQDQVREGKRGSRR